MAEDSNLESRLTLARTIDRRGLDIVDRWLSRVEANVRGREVSPAELRDAMPDYLRRIAEALRTTADTVGHGAAAAWADVAREHALTRVRLGFDVDELVREFILLRQVLFEVATEDGVLLDRTQAARVADLIDAAIAVVVKSYVESRDYEARRREAEHIGFVSHELRNPLATAKLAASRLRRSSSLNAEEARALELLHRNLNRLGRQIEDVLKLERIASGKVEPNARPLALDEVLRDPVANAKAAADAKGLTLSVEYDARSTVCVDPDLTASAVANVLGNAVKYTDAGQVALRCEESAEQVTLHVYDNCPGLSTEELDVIFAPFERGRSKKPGTGLGLAIASQELQAQGGAIGADSAEERGCHFWITLPKQKRAG